MISVGTVSTFATGPQGSSKPDSITTADGSLTTSNGSFFVENGNGADTTGAGGSSTIVQYDKAGNIEHSYTIPGSVDGLKFNPYTGQIWALQNQDGNSTLTLIDPITHTVSTPLSFANPSATRGYDDVVFEGDKVFLSYTNPNGAGDPTLVELINGDRPTGVLLTTTILADGATGFNTVTGKTEVIPQTDPDSLKLAPNGDHMARARRLGIRLANRTNVHGACVPQFNSYEVRATLNAITGGTLDRVLLNILVDAACTAYYEELDRAHS